MKNAQLAACVVFGFGVLFAASAWGDPPSPPSPRANPRAAPTPAPTIAPPSAPPAIGKASGKACAPLPLKVTQVTTSEAPERCRPTTVVMTVTAQTCGAPSGGRYRILAGDRELGSGDVSALTEGASVEVRALWTPPATGTVALSGEVGPRSTSGASGGLAGDTLHRMVNGTSNLLPNGMVGGLGLELTKMGTMAGASSAQVRKLKAQGSYPGWLAAIFDAVANSYEARGKQASSLAEAVLLLCPADAGAKTQPWLEEVTGELKRTNETNKSISALRSPGSELLGGAQGVGHALAALGNAAPFPGFRIIPF